MKASAQKVYAMLREAGEDGVTTGQFQEARIGRIGPRILELREAGHHIVTERLASNRARYYLRSSGALPSPAGSTDAGADPTTDPAGGHSPPAAPGRQSSPPELVFHVDATEKVAMLTGWEWRAA